jgi:cytochrome c-type biogenesis protein CcmH
MSVRRAALAAALLIAAVAPAQSVAAAVPRASLPQIESQVMCVTCKIPLQVAESVAADDERNLIKELIARGEDEGEIKRALVGQYGPSVLGLPHASGFNLVVYVVPVAVVLLLLALLVVLLPRWRRRRPSPALAGAGAGRLSPDDAARLESDLARFEE